MKCDQCGNEDIRFFAYDKGVYYCRKCIGFKRMNAYEKVKPCTLSKKVWVGQPELKYELTPKQKKISREILDYLKKDKDVFVFAATGAGKTECTFLSICYYLSKGKKVGFAISRRQVVLEIAQRLQKAFNELKVIAVTQGYTEVTDGDIIVCTMHQLYRYPQGFDLLIMDEVDAFPFVGNEVLETLANRACRGQKMYLSATPDEENMKKIKNKEMEMVCLFERPHKHPLVIPRVVQTSLAFQIIITIIFCRWAKRMRKQVLVFVPRKQDSVWVSGILRLFVRTRGIHSQTKEKDDILDDFRNKKSDALVCTTLLERGITVPSVQVVVMQAEHIVFTTASLIQIFGRIGRSFDDPTGKGLCLCSHTNKCIQDCVQQLRQMNNSV